jgi:hypothetical protein
MSQEILVSGVLFFAKNMFAGSVTLGFNVKAETYTVSADVMTIEKLPACLSFLLVRVPAEKKPCLGSVPCASYLAL